MQIVTSFFDYIIVIANCQQVNNFKIYTIKIDDCTIIALIVTFDKLLKIITITISCFDYRAPSISLEIERITIH